MTSLLAIDTNAKTVKGQKKGYLTGILYLAPAHESGVMNVCAHASPGCAAACLFTAGRGAFQNVKDARIRKTLFFKSDRESFMAQLVKDINALVVKAKKSNMDCCVRLNGTSDLPWENIKCGTHENIFAAFPSVQFYDYTKNPARMFAGHKAQSIKNYHLTFSQSETNQAVAEMIAKTNKNVAVVFSGKTLPLKYHSRPVINGDETDLRFLDNKGVIVGLKAKGKARKDLSGFVVQLESGGK